MEQKYATYSTDFKKTLNHSDFFIEFKETDTELGYLLFGLDSSLTPALHGKIKNLLLEISEGYFSSPDLSNPEKKFEQELSNFNKKFLQVVKEQINWSKKINITVALWQNGNLHFVNHGYNKLLLIKHKYFIDIINKMSATSSIAITLLFDQIYSGRTDKFFRLALCNQNIFDFISNDKLKDIFSLLPLTNINHQITTITSQLPNKHQMAGVLLQTSAKTTNQAIKPTRQLHHSYLNSIQVLNKTSRLTSKLLNPQFLPEIKWFSFLSKIGKKNKAKLADYKEKKHLKYSQTAAPDKKNKNIYTLIKKYLLRIRHNRQSILVRLKNLPTNLRYQSNNLKNKYQSLPTSSKSLLIIAILLLTILFYNLTSLGLKRKQEVQTTYFQNAVAEINKKLDEAKAAIIYGNNETARELIHSSFNQIYDLPQNNQERLEIFNSLQQRSQTLYNEVNKITEIASPTLLLRLSDFGANESKDIFLLPNRLLITSNETLLNINNENKQISNQQLSKYGFNGSILSTMADDFLFFHDENDNLYRYDPTQDNFANAGTFPKIANQQLTDLATYNNRLYFLDTGNNQIWRLNKQRDGFAPPRPWLTDNYDLSQSKKMSIDGSIYLLNNGTIENFVQGKKTKFILENIEPDLTTATIIKTDSDTPYLYILDPNNKRLVILEKNGKLVKQYLFPTLTNLKNLAYNYKNGHQTLVNLLNGNKIYQIAINE